LGNAQSPGNYTLQLILGQNKYGCSLTRELDVINFGKPPPKKFDSFEPIPAGEVTEGNEESDWAAWEDSVAFQDSLMPTLQGSVTLSADASAKPEPTPPVARNAGPAVEVVEGNEDSHWAEWENSVQLQDSQMADLQASSQHGFAAAKPSSEHVDIFSSIHKNSA
jgi:hypothetical protein